MNNPEEEKAVSRFLYNLPFDRIQFLEGSRPSRLSDSGLFKVLLKTDPDLKSAFYTVGKGAASENITNDECSLKICLGAFSADFGRLEYYRGSFKREESIRLFKDGYGHYGVKKAELGRITYWYAKRGERSSEPVPAMALIDGGLLEGGKSDVQAVLKKMDIQNGEAGPAVVFNEAFKLIDLNAEVFSVYFGDRDVVRIEFLKEMAARDTDMEILRAAEDVVACGRTQYWTNGLREVSSYLFSNERAPSRVKVFIEKAKDVLMRNRSAAVAREIPGKGESKANAASNLFNNISVRIGGTRLDIVYGQ